MRLLTVSLLAAVMLLFSALNASAYVLSATTSYDGHPIVASETITVDIWLDTEGQSNITIISLGVVFDDTQLTYDTVNSDADDFMLFTTGSGATPSRWLEPAVPGGVSYDPPQLILTDQVAVNMIEVNLGGTVATSSNAHMATLLFHVTNPTADSTIWLTIDGQRGGTTFQLGDFTKPPVGLSSPIAIVPEPAIASLSLAALFALYALHARRRSA